MEQGADVNALAEALKPEALVKMIANPLLHWSGKKIPENYRVIAGQSLRPFIAKQLVEVRHDEGKMLLIDRQDGSELVMEFVKKVSGNDGICTAGSYHPQQGLVLALALVALAGALPIDLANDSGEVVEEKTLVRAPKELLVFPLFTQQRIDELLEELGFKFNLSKSVQGMGASLLF